MPRQAQPYRSRSQTAVPRAEPNEHRVPGPHQFLEAIVRDTGDAGELSYGISILLLDGAVPR